MNIAMLMGRLTNDVEMHEGASGPFGKFTLAVKRKKGEESDFIRCTVFGKTATFISTYFSKGDMIAIRGMIQVSNWTDSEGKKRTNTDVIVNEAFFTGAKKTSPTNDNDENTGFFPVDSDDELPF